MSDFKRVKVGRAKTIHIETPLATINIMVGLENSKGEMVERVFVDPEHGVKWNAKHGFLTKAKAKVTK